MSKVSVQEDLKQFKAISAELKEYNSKCKKLREEKKIIENKIMQYLETEDKLGIKYDNLIILNKQKTIHRKLKKSEKVEAVSKFLADLGVKNSNEQTDTLFKKVLKGQEEEVNKLKITQFEIPL